LGGATSASGAIGAAKGASVDVEGASVVGVEGASAKEEVASATPSYICIYVSIIWNKHQK
jgi:hypothetical protein